MRQTKGFKYYLMIFGIAVFALLVYTVFDALKNGALRWEMLLIAIVIPIIFTALLYMFDRIFDFAFKKFSKNKQQDNKEGYEAFLNMINKVVEEQTDFSIEEYRHLRVSDRFQKALKQVYKVYEDGETPELSYAYLQKKFKKNTNEFVALNIVIEEVKKLEKNS
jgi:hypothetical protein